MKVLKERIEEIINLIAEVATGNFDCEIEASETGDELDAVIAGISMLGQELKNSTVSRDFMQSIYQGVVDMLLILNTDFTIRSVNEAFEEISGYKEETLRGQLFSNVFLPANNPTLLSVLGQLKKQGKCLNEELVLSTGQHSKVATSCSFSYLKNSKQEIDGILIIAKDITEIKQKEHDLEEAKNKAEAASESKSNFLSSMSHEIRTPLNGIMGFTDLLMETELNATQSQYIDLIKASGVTLTKLLNDILDLHRIEQDKINLELIPFHFRETIISNLGPYAHLANGKKLNFSYTFDELLPQLVLGDPMRINQILINLVTNAIKFTEEGSIKIHFGIEEIEADYVLLKCSVTDTGIGIPQKKQAMIFESFTQSDQSTTRKYGGFGLGLAISLRLAHLMQGNLGVASPPPGEPKGSAFWFSVKLQQVKDKPVIEAPESIVRFQLKENARILVADDNIMNLMLMQKMFNNLGTTITTVQSAREAIDLARSEAFDLVFMDIQMPEMDGLEAAKMLRKANFDKPIVAFSANAYQDDIHKSLAAGMNDHLCKPFSRNELINILQKWM